MNTSILLRSTLATLVVAGLFGTAACGNDAKDTGAYAPSASASASVAAFNTADVAFATDMIPHHQQAVEMADHAATRAASPEVKQLAAEIKAAQGPEIDKMSGWLTAWGKPVPSTAPSAGHGEHAGMPGMMSDADMRKLMAATGAAFDRMFLTMMIAHHEGAITMAKDEQAKGANPEAKQLAAAIAAAQTTEITKMKQMLTSL